MNRFRLFQSAAIVLLIAATLTNFFPGISSVTAATTGEVIAETRLLANTSLETRCPDVISPPGVDSLDIRTVAQRWQFGSADPGYESRYDLDSSGRIDIVDIMLTAAQWNTQSEPPTEDRPVPRRARHAGNLSSDMDRHPSASDVGQATRCSQVIIWLQI